MVPPEVSFSSGSYPYWQATHVDVAHGLYRTLGAELSLSRSYQFNGGYQVQTSRHKVM